MHQHPDAARPLVEKQIGVCAMSGWASRWMTAGNLSDGRFQQWVVDKSGRIWTSWPDGIDQVYWQRHAAPFVGGAMAVAPLSDKRLQLWSVDDKGHIWSCWKSTTASDAPWTGWAATWTPVAPTFKAVSVASAPLSDGRLQFWATDDQGHLWTCWKSTTASNAPWSPWKQHAAGFKAVRLAVAPLSDKRLQLWATDNTGRLWTCWKPTAVPSSPWTPWTLHATTFKSASLAVGPLSDKRLQLWAVDDQGRAWSCWKSTVISNSPWTAWTLAWITDAPSFKVAGLSVAPLTDKRLQVWAADATGVVRTAFKTTTSSSAAWSNWALEFPMVKQEQTNWCWSGCATATAHFFDPASAWTQCAVASDALGVTTCCTDPAPCNVYGYLNKALTTVGHFKSMAGSTEPDATITSESNNGLPLGVRVAWKGGGAHFIMVVGGGPNDMVLVKDPIYGLSYISYATLSGSYQGSGTWTHSYFTQA